MAHQADVVFVDGVRTPFGKAGEKGMYWNTRADDLVVKAIVGLLERNRNVPKDRIDDVAIAATTQTGDQGLTLGRTAAILAGLPKTVPGFSIDRMCAGAMTAAAMVSGSIGFGMYGLAIAGGVEHMGHHPMGSGVDPNPRFLSERLVGFHFFTPVALMPLIEVVTTPHTDEATLSTAMVTAKNLRKNAVITADTPGFVVNRLLAVLLGEAMKAVDEGTSFETVDTAIAPLGLPMAPSALLDLVGLKVGAHVLDTHHAAFPDRFYRSENLHRLADYGRLLDKDDKGKVKGFDKGALKLVAGGKNPRSANEILVSLQDGLAREVRLMLDDRVVAAPEDIDLCMILGAGFPFQMGGVTPYLDRVGASERVFGSTFHTPPVRGVES